MRRILLLAALLTMTTAITAPTADAAASTCAIHQSGVSAWSLQTDIITTSWDFKCGGANNDDYYLNIGLNKKHADGQWYDVPCDNGNYCNADKPPYPGFFNGGSEHSGTNTWNVQGQIDCATYRVHVAVWFRSDLFDFIVFNSNSQAIGGC